MDLRAFNCPKNNIEKIKGTCIVPALCVLQADFKTNGLEELVTLMHEKFVQGLFDIFLWYRIQYE